MELIKGKYDSIDFKPPAGVRAAAKRGLELRRKFGRGGLSAQQAGEQGIGSGVQRASNLSNGSAVSPDTIKRMVSFFARHERNKNSKMPNGEPGAGMIAWLLWGGDPGQRWANKVKGQMDKIDGVEKSAVHRLYKAEHTGAMIALFLPANIGQKFAVTDENALDPSEMHVTVIYLGKYDDLSFQNIQNLHYQTGMIAGMYPPLIGNINGCGRFCNGDDEGDPFFIIPDLPLLPELRGDIVKGLNEDEITLPPRLHGYTPHITLSYIPHDMPNPFSQVELTAVEFPSLSLVLGGDRYDYPFSAKNSLNKSITIDGVTVSIEDLLSALKQPAGGQREALREAQRKRQDKYRIRVQPGGALTIPAALARLGAKAEDFADPVNFRYPVWLTKPDRDSLTPTQLAQVRNAPARFAQFSDRYDPMSRAQVESRIDEARKKFQIGEFAETEKSWDCQIFKRDNEKQVALSVALKASGGDNGIRPDSQKDVLTVEEVEQAAYGFMLNSRRFDLHHQQTLSTSQVSVVESYLSPVDFKAGKTQVMKGDWIVGVYFRDSALWEKVKKGEINALSIKGTGRRIPFGG